MSRIKNKLYEKGWSQKDIYHTISVIYRAESKKSKFVKVLDIIIFWLILFLSLMITVVVGMSLIPILIVLKGFILYLSIITIALCFGYFFEILLRDIEQLEPKHHLLINIVIPIFVVLVFMFVVNYSNSLEKIFKVDNEQNPYVIGTVFLISFLLPYLYYQVYKKRYL